MNNDDIMKARKKYEKLMKEKKQLLLLQHELYDLENNDIVKRYLELKAIVSHKPLQDDQIVRYSFGNVDTLSIPQEDKIYIYMGAYKYDFAFDSRNDTLVHDENREFFDYLLYKNIDDSFDSVSIKPKQKESFENAHTILKFKNTFNINNKYYQLQQYYYQLLLSVDFRKKSKILVMLKEKMK